VLRDHNSPENVSREPSPNLRESFVARKQLPTSVISAMTADAVRHHRLATVGTNRWIYCDQRIVRAALVFLRM